MLGIPAKLQHLLNKRTQSDSLRSISTEKYAVDFYSNDYLGLARNVKLSGDIEKETESFEPTMRNGSTGSRLISGNHAYMAMVEEEAAIFFETESALAYNSGYSANLGLLSALGQKDDVFFYDALAHASLKDGMRLSLANKISFKHNDIQDLKRKLQTYSGKGTKYIVIESIYSMDGDIAPLKEMCSLAQNYEAYIILDEAHSTGLYEQGTGLTQNLGLQKAVTIRVHTFGKALGTHGAMVCGPSWLKSFLVNFSRPFIYTTAPSLHQFAAMRVAMQHIQKADNQRAALLGIIGTYLHSVPIHSDFLFSKNQSPIQYMQLLDNHSVTQRADQLRLLDIGIKAILPPTVPDGKARLRICLHSFNTKTEIDLLFST